MATVSGSRVQSGGKRPGRNHACFLDREMHRAALEADFSGVAVRRRVSRTSDT